MRHLSFRLWAQVISAAVFLTAASAAADGPTAISLTTPVSGTISAAAEVDWYSVTTDTVGDLLVTQTAWPPYIDTRIAVFGPNSQTLAQANPVVAAAPGTYYIKVWSFVDGISTSPYTFNATLTKAVTGNDIDKGGNAAAAAVPITLGAAVSDTIAPSKETAGTQDVDWFTVTTDTVGDLAVTQTAWPPYIETKIAIFGPNNPALAQANPLPAAAPGTYYIKVWSYVDGTSISPYTFSAGLTKAATGNDIDKGRNSAAGAVPITLGTAVSDTIAPSKETAGTQDIDWFSVITTVVGDLTVTQTAWPPNIETKIAVFGPNDPLLPLSNPTKAAVPGTYYIKVWSVTDGSSIAPYTFTADLKAAAGDAGSGAGRDAGGTADTGGLVGLDASAGRDAGAMPDTGALPGSDAAVGRETGIVITADAGGLVAPDAGIGRETGIVIVADAGGLVAPDAGAGTTTETGGLIGLDASAGRDVGGTAGAGGTADAASAAPACKNSGCSVSGRFSGSQFPAVPLLLFVAIFLMRRPSPSRPRPRRRDPKKG